MRHKFFVVLLMNYSEVGTVIEIFCCGFRILFENTPLNCRSVHVRRARERSVTETAR